MTDNVTANAGSGGADFVTAGISWSGDTDVQLPGSFLGIITGSEGAWTFTTLVGGAGAVTAGTQRVTLASDDPAVTSLASILSALGGTITVDGSGATQPVSGTVTAELSAIDNAVLDAIATLLAGTLTVDGSGTTQPVSGTVTAELSATDNSVLDAIVSALGGTLTVDGSGATQPVSGSVAVPAATTGGATPGKLISAASTNATSVKASAGTLYVLAAFNIGGSPVHLKLYNKSSAPTVGTDTPVMTLTIPGNTAGGGFVLPIPPCGIAFSNGIAFALTTGIADSDTGAVSADEIAVDYSYA